MTGNTAGLKLSADERGVVVLCGEGPCREREEDELAHQADDDPHGPVEPLLELLQVNLSRLWDGWACWRECQKVRLCDGRAGCVACEEMYA